MTELEIHTPDGRRMILTFSGEYMGESGQHGRSAIFIDKKTKKKWMVKIFPHCIDPELGIDPLPVDLGWSSEEMRTRCQYARAASEVVASIVAQKLDLNVPEVFVVPSENVASFEIKSNHPLPLEKGTKQFVDKEDQETFEEHYQISEREDYTLKKAKKWDDYIISETGTSNPEHTLALVSELIPDAMTIDQACDKEGTDEIFKNLRESNSGYYLLPYDVWLNDPDRNAGNYLLTKHDMSEDDVWKVFGIDYEMWSFGETDIIDPDDILKGRGYLAAILHKTATSSDSRVLETLHKIRSLSESDVIRLSKLPLSMIKFVEYNIASGLAEENRDVVRQLEENFKDFLWESKPRMSRLEENIKIQLD